MHGVLVFLSILIFMYARIHFCAIAQVLQFIQLGYIQELPLHQLHVAVLKTILLPCSDQLCLIERLEFVFGLYKTQLFIELRQVVTITANDTVHQFCEIPVHAIERLDEGAES